MCHILANFKHFCFYLTVAEKDNKDDKIKTSMLLTCIDQIVKYIYETFTIYLADDERKIKPVLNKLI